MSGQSLLLALPASQDILINYWFCWSVLPVMVVLLLSLSLPLCCTYSAQPASLLTLPTASATGNVLLRYRLPPDKYLSDTQLRQLRQYVKDMADLARQRGSERAIIDELIVELLANTGV